MTRIKLTIRILATQEIMLKRVAEARGLTRYQALLRAIEQGLAVMMNGPAHNMSDDGLADISARLSVIEALADRGLFTASAAYVYARRGALRGDNDATQSDTNMSAAAQAAYQRQRTLAEEILS